jgi:hypothetical protein
MSNVETLLSQLVGSDAATILLAADGNAIAKTLVDPALSKADYNLFHTKGGKGRTVSDLKVRVGQLIKEGFTAKATDESTVPQVDSAVEAITFEDQTPAENQAEKLIGTADIYDTAPAAPAVVEVDVVATRATLGLPEDWTDDEVKAYLAADGVLHGVTRHGNRVVDPSRARRELTKDELIDALNGDFAEYDETHHTDLVTQLRQVEIVPAAWNTRSVVEYVRMGIVPPQAAPDVWVEDLTRLTRPAEDWTDAELTAWLANSIVSPEGAVATVQKLAVEVVRRFDYKCDASPEAVKAHYVKLTSAPQPSTLPTEPRAKATAPAAKAVVAPVESIGITAQTYEGLSNMNLTYIQTLLDFYASTCGVNHPVSFDTGVKAQRKLDDVLRYVINIEDPKGFVSGMSILLDFVAKHRGGMFSHTYIYRFTGGLRVEGQVQESHIQLLELFHIFTDPNKLVRTQCDIAAYVSKLPHARQAFVIEYFTTLA